MNLAFEAAGEGRPLLAVHGNFASRRWFKGLLASPPQGFRVIAPDLPGHGGSREFGGNPSIAGFADALEGLVAALELDAPVLLGHSMGGAVVLELASRRSYPGLVLIASPSLVGYPHDPAFDPARERMRSDRALLEAAFLAQSPGLTAAGREEVDFAGLLDDAQAMHDSAYSGNAQALGRWNILERAGRLANTPTNTPTLILGGELDPLVPPAMLRELAGQLPHARLTFLPNVGHWPLLEAPEASARVLERFLEEV